MQDIADRLSVKLNNYSLIIYIDDAFPWKEQVYERYGKSEGVLLASDPSELELYRTYEFSDRFCVLAESGQYGSVWNYVRRGILTPGDALEAVIGERV